MGFDTEQDVFVTIDRSFNDPAGMNPVDFRSADPTAALIRIKINSGEYAGLFNEPLDADFSDAAQVAALDVSLFAYDPATQTVLTNDGGGTVAGNWVQATSDDFRASGISEIDGLQTALDAKQDALSGAEGQRVGFDANGEPIAEDVPMDFINVDDFITDFSANNTANIQAADAAAAAAGLPLRFNPSNTYRATGLNPLAGANWRTLGAVFEQAVSTQTGPIISARERFTIDSVRIFVPAGVTAERAFISTGDRANIGRIEIISEDYQTQNDNFDAGIDVRGNNSIVGPQFVSNYQTPFSTFDAENCIFGQLHAINCGRGRLVRGDCDRSVFGQTIFYEPSTNSAPAAGVNGVLADGARSVTFADVVTDQSIGEHLIRAGGGACRNVRWERVVGSSDACGLKWRPGAGVYHEDLYAGYVDCWDLGPDGETPGYNEYLNMVERVNGGYIAGSRMRARDTAFAGAAGLFVYDSTNIICVDGDWRDYSEAAIVLNNDSAVGDPIAPISGVKIACKVASTTVPLLRMEYGDTSMGDIQIDAVVSGGSDPVNILINNTGGAGTISGPVVINVTSAGPVVVTGSGANDGDIVINHTRINGGVSRRTVTRGGQLTHVEDYGSEPRLGIGVDPQHPLGVMGAPFDTDTAAVGAAEGTLFIRSTGAPAAEDALGAGIAFGAVVGGDRRRCAIAPVQTGTDPDHVGLNFYVHAFPQSGNETMTLAFTLRHDGVPVFPSLPVADPAIAGALWNNAGALSVSAG